MEQGWVTVLLLAFGIAVAVVGVIAYLRMLRKDKSGYLSSNPVSPPDEAVARTEERDSDASLRKD
ncbi:hypothetical protein [Paenibacillus sp. PL2-23]|uniref:hypothetical protein n=1 Tax=Paenibacillus sp. PL2-23 TaxID=2100729 RepID=UPI0030F85375